MGARAKIALRPLSEAEQRSLQRVARASSERVDAVKRAKALLAVAAGKSLTQAASRPMEPRREPTWCRRCADNPIARAIKARPGRSNSCSARYGELVCPPSGRPRLGASCMRKATVCSATAPGVTQGSPIGYAKTGSTACAIRRPRKKKIDRAGLSCSGGMWIASVVPGRGWSLCHPTSTWRKLAERCPPQAAAA